ncbi:MAG: methyltransferase domain-containing protein [Verrucomicrobia bacterium]|nr:methyltransferase domain-containing protein [Verrucomicrobiota bacterium]
MMDSGQKERESFLICRNSQGVQIRASILRLTRYIVAFEVYNPYSILQSSEVLSGFQIFVNTHMVYAGRAVVRSLINTGIYLVAEADLNDGWLGVDLFSPVKQRERLLAEFHEFLNQWTNVQQVNQDFKIVISDLQSLLGGLRGWLEQVELGIRSEPSGDHSAIEQQVISDLQPAVLPHVHSLFTRFEAIAASLPEQLQPLHQFYLRRQLHPFLLSAPFVYRIYQKPLGYAGDYEMVNMILRSPYEGSSIFAKLLNTFFLSQPPAEAHRNRIKYLTARIVSETKRVARLERPARIFNLGCGPAREIQDFLIQGDISDLAEFTLLDFNEETLRYTANRLNELKKKYNCRMSVTYLPRSVSQILRDSRRADKHFLPESYDLVYCAGLFDYLSDRVCRMVMEILYALLAPAGLLIATNVAANNPVRNMMEYVGGWNLIHRDACQLASLRPQAEAEFDVTSDPTSLNIFFELRKPEKAK